MNRVIGVVISVLIVLGTLNIQFETVDAFDATEKYCIFVSQVDNRANFRFKTDKTGSSEVFLSDTGEEKLIWDSPVDTDKPVDIDKVYISHDSYEIHVRISLHSKVEDRFDPYISIGIDTDLDENTGMPKLNTNSYNMGGEDFFARFSTGYGYQKFILDAWDSQRGDTIETGGLGEGVYKDDQISFSIPRRAIGNPVKLDLKVVGRVYQATNPDLSPDHLTYSLTSTEHAEGVTAIIKNGECVITTDPINQSGLYQYHIKTDERIYAVSHYVICDSIDDEEWVELYQSNPSMYKRLNIASVGYKISDDRIWFNFRFWDGLKHMGEYDYKIWVMCDTGPGGGFDCDRYCDGSNNYIMEVSTESGRTTSKLYSVSKGMGYNQPHLTDIEIDDSKGIVSFSCKLSRLGNPNEMDVRIACGGWKAPESYWDSTDKLMIQTSIEPDELVFEKIIDDGEDECTYDIRKVECVHNDNALFFRIGLKEKLDEQNSRGIVRIMINSDLDVTTGLPPSSVNAGGEDKMIEIEIDPYGIVGQVFDLSDSNNPKLISTLDVSYENSLLEVSVDLVHLQSTKGIIFFVVSRYSNRPGLDDVTEWNLMYSLTDSPIEEPCYVVAPYLVHIEDDGQVELQWKPINEEIKGYNIYRAIAGKDFERINDDIIGSEQTDFIDDGLTNGLAYRYYIRTVCPNGTEGLKSNTVSAKPKAIVTTPIIHISPSIVDMGEILNPLGQYRSVQIKNDGPVNFDGIIIPQTDWLSVNPTNISLKAGESIDVKISITKNLVAGNYTGTLMLKGSGVNRSVTITTNVLKSAPYTDFVNNLQADAGIGTILLSWNPPTYNHEELIEYKITRTESYMGSEVGLPEIIAVEQDETEFLDGGIDSESTFTYSVVPVYQSGEGIPRIVSASPNPQPVYILMSIGKNAATVDNKSVTIDVPPTIIDDRTMVPFRFIGEAINASIDYDADSRTAIFQRGRRIVEILIGGATANIDGVEVKLEPPATIVNGRTMIPLRFISEAFHAEVQWDEVKRTVEIFYPENYRPQGWTP